MQFIRPDVQTYGIDQATSMAAVVPTKNSIVGKRLAWRRQALVAASGSLGLPDNQCSRTLPERFHRFSPTSIFICVHVSPPGRVAPSAAGVE